MSDDKDSKFTGRIQMDGGYLSIRSMQGRTTYIHLATEKGKREVKERK